MFYFTSLNPRSENNKKAASLIARFSFLSLFKAIQYNHLNKNIQENIGENNIFEIWTYKYFKSCCEYGRGGVQ